MDTTRFRERWPNTTPTSLSTYTSGEEPTIDTRNGEPAPDPEKLALDKLALEDTLVIETTDGKRHEYEVVGLVTDSDTDILYGVAYSEENDDFIVTDDAGKLIDDQALVDEIIRDFEIFAEESAPEDD